MVSQPSEKSPGPIVQPSSHSISPCHDSTQNIPSYPYGWLRAWSTLIGAFLLQFASVGPITAFGVFQDFYTSHWMSRFSASDISWIGSTQLFLDLGLGYFAGRLYDFGYGAHILFAGSFIYAFCFFMTSLGQPQEFYQVFLSQGLGMGIGVGLVFIPTLTVVSIHFHRHRALAMGIATSSGAFGGFIYSVILNQLIQSVGFPWAVRAAAFVSLGCFVAGNILITVPKVDRNADAGLSPTSWFEWPYMLTLLSGFIAQLGTYFPLFYVQLFADAHGMSKSFVFYALSIMNISSMFGRIVPNHFADKHGALGTLVVCEFLNGLSGLLMLAAGHPAGLVTFSIVYGFFFGSTISVYAPAVAIIAPRQADRGKSIGLAMGPVGVASLIGPPMLGAVMGQHSLSWWKGIIFASLALVCASSIQLVSRVIFSRRRLLT